MEAKFKHIVIGNGSLAARERFVNELGKIGYPTPKKGQACLYLGTGDYYCVTVNYNNNNSDNNRIPDSGKIDGFSNEGAHWRKKGFYQFEIDNDNEFQAALAIAAIREDENSSFIGEIWYYGTASYRITKVDGARRWIIGINTNFTEASYGHPIPTSSPTEWRKATPEEIIQHFNTTKSTNMPLTNGKKIIGYKLTKPEYREAALVLAPSSEYLKTGKSGQNKSYISLNTNVHRVLQEAGVLDLWFKPVYEEDEIKIGGYTAVREGNLIAFGCQKFSTEQLRHYRLLLSGSETKAELTVAGTKITTELIDKLIEML